MFKICPIKVVIRQPAKSKPLVLLAWDFWWTSAGGIKRLFLLFETLCFKKRQKLGILWPNIAKTGASGKSRATRASSWFSADSHGRQSYLYWRFKWKYCPFLAVFETNRSKMTKKYNNWCTDSPKIFLWKYQWQQPIKLTISQKGQGDNNCYNRKRLHFSLK